MKEFKDIFNLARNQKLTKIGEIYLIAKLTCWARMKVWYIDHIILCKKVIAYRIKETLGITG